MKYSLSKCVNLSLNRNVQKLKTILRNVNDILNNLSQFNRQMLVLKQDRIII